MDKQAYFERNLERMMKQVDATHNPYNPLFASTYAHMAIGMLDRLVMNKDKPVDEQKKLAKVYTKSLMGLVDKLNQWANDKV